MAEDFANELDFYDYPKIIAKCKKEEGENSKNLTQLVRNLLNHGFLTY